MGGVGEEGELEDVGEVWIWGHRARRKERGGGSVGEQGIVLFGG